VLAFLGTAYFDDVCTSKPVPARGASLATIDTIAVHPDFLGA
jgi:hypothetical protein